MMLGMKDDTSNSANKTKAQHKMDMMRKFTGGPKQAAPPGTEGLTFGFAQTKHMVLECAGVIQVKVMANKKPGCSVSMQFRTVEGAAKAGVRYRDTVGTVRFAPNDLEQFVEVPIIDNDVWEAEEDFIIELSNLQVIGGAAPPKMGFGIQTTTVVVLNDDEPGTLAFAVDEVMACEGVTAVSLMVTRTNGTCGNITVKYETVDDTAFQGQDYHNTAGTLSMVDGQTTATIDVRLAITGPHPDDRRFRLVLSEPSTGVKFDANTDGGDACAICEIIKPGNHRESLLSRSASAVVNQRKCEHGLAQWTEQFPAAFFVSGSAEEQAQAGMMDWFFHALSLFWKVLFAFVPPPIIGGGWVSFVAALGMIGGVTAIVGDMATLLGCCLGIPNDITAITLVALGTSLPDTFASRTAAQHDDCADNSIGNVTGSNSVNVFLGLGLPWTMGAFYWSSMGRTEEWDARLWKGETYKDLWGETYPAGGFLVPAGSLSFSVSVFVATAITCICLLVLRRRMYGGELGGPASAQQRDAVILVGLWTTYVGASIWKSLSGP